MSDINIYTMKNIKLFEEFESINTSGPYTENDILTHIEIYGWDEETLRNIVEDLLVEDQETLSFIEPSEYHITILDWLNDNPEIEIISWFDEMNTTYND